MGNFDYIIDDIEEVERHSGNSCKNTDKYD
jgi:hypothetical protein